MSRRPVNAPYSISGEFGEYYGAAAKFLYHSGVDYALPTGREVYAPVSGHVTSYVWGPYHGNVVQIYDGQFYHRLMHNSQLKVHAGQSVTEGQLVALSGATGQGVTGPHVHWDICTEKEPTAFANFRDPAKWLNGDYKTTVTPQGGDEMIVNDTQARDAYYLLRGDSAPTAGEISGTSGKRTWAEFAITAKAEVKNREAYKRNLEAQVTSLQTTIRGMQESINGLSSRPTNAEYAKVQAALSEKINELSAVVTELQAEKQKVKEVVVYTHDEETKQNVSLILKLVKSLWGSLTSLHKKVGK